MSLSIVVHGGGDHVSVTIEDNGCGLNPDLARETTHESGLGLAGMRERLLLIDGELKIESSPGSGTAIFARIRPGAAS